MGLKRFETWCMGFPNQFSGCPNAVAFPYARPLHWEAMELAGHSSKHISQQAKKISGFLQA